MLHVMFFVLLLLSLNTIYYVSVAHDTKQLQSFNRLGNGGWGQPELVSEFCFVVLRVSWKFLHHVIDLKLHKEFIVWAALKYRFSNGCYYNYNLLKLSRVSGFGRTKLRKHIGLFLKLGWCRLHHGNLIFESVKTLHQKQFGFPPEKWTQFKISLQDLHLKLIENKLRQKAYINNKLSDLQVPRTLKDHKSAKSYFKSVKRFRFDEGISLNSLAKCFNLSRSSACHIVKHLKQASLITVQRRSEILGDYCPQKLAYAGKGYFKSGNKIKRNLPSVIALLG